MHTRPALGTLHVHSLARFMQTRLGRWRTGAARSSDADDRGGVPAAAAARPKRDLTQKEIRVTAKATSSPVAAAAFLALLVSALVDPTIADSPAVCRSLACRSLVVVRSAAALVGHHQQPAHLAGLAPIHARVPVRSLSSVSESPACPSSPAVSASHSLLRPTRDECRRPHRSG